MTNATRLTPGELRTNAQRITDEVIKGRVLAGIALLEERYGPDWVDRIEPADLDLADGASCVLGQVYAGAEVGEEQWREYRATPAGRHSEDEWQEATGYERGLAILDGDLTATEEDGAARYGFLISRADLHAGYDYSDLQAAWVIALGE